MRRALALKQLNATFYLRQFFQIGVGGDAVITLLLIKLHLMLMSEFSRVHPGNAVLIPKDLSNVGH